jgi:hypothetical protein
MAKNTKNPRNPDTPLFKQLTRLLSGPLVNYRRQIPRRNKRRQLDKFASKFTSASGKHFKKTSYDTFENLTSNILANQSRVERYSDFEQMEYEPIIASAMDIYADEMTTSSELQPLLTIKCPNEEIKLILSDLYHKVLNLEHNLFGWCRTMCKFGDFFLYLDLDETKGIQNVIGIPTSEVERLEGEDKTNPNYIQYQWNSGGLTFENWQIAHFRILGNDKYAPYGTSVLEACRRIWRQLTLLEDAVMAYRIVRSPERRVFYVDVGGVNPEDVEQYMQKVMTQMKRNQVVDSTTGRVDLRYNPLSIEEDYFVPVRGGVSTKIESLSGGAYTGDIDDVKYLKNKLFAALKIPQAYLFQGEGADTEDKTTLAQKDIRFARTIQRLQRALIAELEKVGVIHLYTIGYRGEDLISFKLSLSNPSKIAELQELEHWRMKFDTAGSATEGFFSKRWIAQHLFAMSDEEFIRNQREMFHDRKFDVALETEIELTSQELMQQAQQVPLGAPGGMPAEVDTTGDLPAEEGAPAEGGAPAEEGVPAEGGVPAEEGVPAEGGAPAEEGGEETALLAAPPAKRDADWYKVQRSVPFERPQTTTDASKGKLYTPVLYDKRYQGARRKHYLRQAAPEMSTPRKIHPGYSELRGLARGLYEGKETNYKDDEELLFEVDKEVQELISELETKDKKSEVKT